MFFVLRRQRRGAMIREFLFVAGMNPRSNEKLVKAFENRLGFPLFEDASRGLTGRQIDELLKPAAKLPIPGDDADALIYENFRKRIGDVPSF